VLMAIGDLWRLAGTAGTPARSGPACWLIVAGEPW
jgi:hypothetical protein